VAAAQRDLGQFQPAKGDEGQRGAGAPPLCKVQRFVVPRPPGNIRYHHQSIRGKENIQTFRTANGFEGPSPTDAQRK